MVSAAALVTDVELESPAGRAGLMPGDLIRRLDGAPVADLAHLLRALDARRVGDQIVLSVKRPSDSEPRDILIHLASLEDVSSRADFGFDDTGISFSAGEPANISSVEVGSLAEAANLRPGDVILMIGLQHVEDAAEAEDLLDESTGLVGLLVRRGESPARFLVLGMDRTEVGVLGGNNLGVLSATR